MEKLQAAIERARERRDGAAPLVQPAAAPRFAGSQIRRGPSRAKTEAIAGAWQALPVIEPDPKQAKNRRLVSTTATQEAAQFDILRTKTLLEMRRNGWTRLAITSPTPSCGKTTTAANLAAGIGRQREMRAVLFDFDLRRPAVGQMFGYKPQTDITDMLSGEVDFAEHAVRIGGNVAVAAARRPASDPTRVLLDDATMRTIDQVAGTYAPDLMIFDMPPILVRDDTRAFLRNVDCALIVARAEVSTASQIDIAEREVAEYTNVLGVVLNQCRFEDDGYGYGDAYEYGQPAKS